MRGIIIIIGILISVAYITLGERKIMGGMQRRKGPDKRGVYGLIQPIIDGGKLFIKELIIPLHTLSSSRESWRGGRILLFFLGPFSIFIFSLLIWIPLPFGNPFLGGFLLQPHWVEDQWIWGGGSYPLLYILVLSSLSSFLLLYAGWVSHSKYTMIGAIRGVSQIISYEVSIAIIIMNIIILSNSFSPLYILSLQIEIPFLFPLFPISLLFFLSALAETARPPFDLTEAESELVAGVLTEYSGLNFILLYLSEYTYLFFLSLLSSLLFFGSTYYTPLFILLFFWVRVALPRITFPQLLQLGWNKILPYSISSLSLLSSLSLTLL